MVDLPIWHDEFTDLSFATDAGGGTWRTKGYEAGGTLAKGFKDYAGSSWNISPIEHPQHNPFSVTNSVLTITAKRVTADVKAVSLEVDPNVEWMGGYLVSNHLAGLTWRFGYFEFRARFPNPARGMFPALWLFNNIPDAQRGNDGKQGAELDILEVFGEPDGKPWASGIHFEPTALDSGVNSGSHGYNVATTDNDTTGWHRYGLEWTTDKIAYYKDGVLVAQVTDPVSIAWYRTANLGLRLNYAIDPIWITPGDPLRTLTGGTNDPALGYEYRMEVDYVRVFSRLPAELTPGSSADPLSGVIGGSTLPPELSIPVTVADDFNVRPATVPPVVTPGAIRVADDFNIGLAGTAAPAAPTDLVATPLNAGAAVSWTHAGAGVTGFTITATSGTLTRVYTAPPTTRTLAITGLDNDLVWLLSLVANGAGGASAVISTTVSPTPTSPAGGTNDPTVQAPGAPDLTGVTAGPASIYATWTAPADNGGREITAYIITAVATTIPTGSLTYPTFKATVSAARLFGVVTGLINDLTYSVTVQAYSSAGASLDSDALTATPDADADLLLPAPITNLDAEALSRGADLTWTQGDLGLGTFVAYDIVAYGTTETLTYRLDVDQDGCEIAGMTNSQAYTVSVVVRTTVGESVPTTVTVTPSSSGDVPPSTALRPIVPDAPPVVVVPERPRTKQTQPVVEAFVRGMPFHPTNFDATGDVQRGAVGQLALVEIYKDPNDGIFKVARSIKLVPSFGAIFYDDLDMGFPEIRASARNNPDSSGTYDETKYHGARSIALSLKVLKDAFRDYYGFEDWDQSIGWSRDDFWITLVTSFMSPEMRIRIFFAADKQGGKPRFMDVRAAGASAPMTSSNVRQLLLQFISPSGKIQDFDVTTAATEDGRTVNEIRQTEAVNEGREYPLVYPRVYPDAARGALSVLYQGSVANAPTLRIFSDPGIETENPRVTITPVDERDNPTGPAMSIGFDGLTIPPGQFIEIDCAERTVNLMGDPTLRQNQYLSAPLNWPVFKPGLNKVDFTVGSGSTVGSLAYVQTLHYNAFLL